MKRRNKSQSESKEWLEVKERQHGGCKILLTSALTPVTFDAALKHPITFWPFRRLEATCSSIILRCAISTFPSTSSSTCKTRSAISRQGNKLEWCSHGPAMTIGGGGGWLEGSSSLLSSRRAFISLCTAPVAPLETKMTASCSEALTEFLIASLASWRYNVDCNEVTVDVVCVLP